MFKHFFIDRIELVSEDTPDGRLYNLPDGSKVQSVTTRIGKYYGTEWLIEWKNRVGEDVANQISYQATTRGSAVHAILEKIMMNDPFPYKGAMPVNVDSVRVVKPILLNNVETVYGIEYPLYSYSLQTAGRADLIASWLGIPMIIDFKTSKKKKTRSQIEDYFVQATCYALMFNGKNQFKINDFAIIILVDNDEPQIFCGKVSDYEALTRKVFQCSSEQSLSF